MRKREETHLHFVGIGGIGMSGIAEVFLNQGYQVSGSDLADSETTRKLASSGAKIFSGHKPENVRGAHVVVVSSAVSAKNLEVLEARRLRIPVIPRAEMLGELMRGKTGIAIAGTHGKTTTTSMLATVFTRAGLDPTIVIGGKVDSLGGNAKLGQGKFVIAEADESDGSFLYLPATYGVITNIDNDHLDHFGHLSAIEDAFVGFVGKLPFYGLAAVCADDPGVAKCLTRLTKPFVTYGLSEEWDYSAQNIRTSGMSSVFDVRWKGTKTLGTVTINVPGKHNVLNALATVTTGMELDLPFDSIVRGLEEFRGVKRRFDIRWQNLGKEQIVVDDYGHHPTEISATLAAARSYWPGRIITVFQPHRFSRTLHCRDGFVTAFHQSDVVLVTDIYAAGEEPIDGVTGESLVPLIRKLALPHQEVFHVGDLANAKKEVLNRFRNGDMILCLGAGSITGLAEQLAADFGSER